MIHVTSVQAPAPTPPAMPAAPGGMIVTPRMLGGAPMTAREVSALLARKEMLSDQLVSAASRRRELSRQLRSATGADRTGLEQRLGVLDARIARLETDIDETGKLLAAPQVAEIAQQRHHFIGWGPGGPNGLSGNVTQLFIVFTLFVLSPIALSITRLVWRRGSLPRQQGIDRDTAQRLERMEQGIDSIAIEMERVSEGQRFVTRLLAEGRQAVVVGGQGSPPAVEQGRVPMNEVRR